MSIYRDQLYYDNSTNTLNSSANLSVSGKLVNKIYKVSSVNTATQSIPTAVLTPVVFNTDTLVNWPTRTTNTQFVAPTAGTYAVSATLGYPTAPGTAGTNKALLVLNGTSGTILSEQSFPYATVIGQFTLNATISMNGTTDYVQCLLYQSSGAGVNSGGANSDIAGNYYNTITVTRIGT